MIETFYFCDGCEMEVESAGHLRDVYIPPSKFNPMSLSDDRQLCRDCVKIYFEEKEKMYQVVKERLNLGVDKE